MRIFFIVFISVISLFAEKYSSFHQFPDEEGKVSFYDQIKDNTSAYINIFASLPYHGESIACRSGRQCYETKDPRQKDWYGTNWMRYRVYIPKNVKDFSFNFGSIANTTFVALYYFVPDGSAVQDVDFRQYKLTKTGRWEPYKDFSSEDERNRYFFQGYKLLYVEAYNSSGLISFDNIAKYNTQGGWLYINLAQACTVTDCWFGDGREGDRSDAKPYLAFTLYFKDKLPNILNEFKSIKFDSQKDPIENFSVLHEIHRTLSGSTIKNIYGNHDGSYLFDLDQPDFDIKNVLNANTLQYDVTLEAGNAPIKGISVEQNSNVTFSFKIDNCLQIIRTSKNSNQGEYFYSEDGAHWFKDFNESTHYIKYTIASSDDSGIVLYPHDKLLLNIQNRIIDCTGQIKSDVEVLFSLKDQNKTLKKESIVLYKKSSSSAATSSVASTAPSSTTRDASRDAEQCEASGGIWLDTFCQRPSSQSSSQVSRSSSSSVSSVSSSSNSSSLNQEAENCEASGGIWLDTFCQRPSSQSSSQVNGNSSSFVSNRASSYASVSSSQDNMGLLELINALADRNLSINGYFAYFGDVANYEPLKWVYLSVTTNTFAKLEGMDPQTKLLKWKRLRKYFKTVSFKNGHIVVGKPVDNINESDRELVNALADRNLSINGYFAYFGDVANYEPLKWVYLSVTTNTFAKLEGMDPQTKLLKWKRLRKYFKTVSFKNGHIVVGEPVDDIDEMLPKSSSSSSSVSSIISSSSSSASQSSETDSNDEQSCVANGGEWLDTFCSSSSRSYSSLSSSSVSSSFSQSSSNNSNTAFPPAD